LDELIVILRRFSQEFNFKNKKANKPKQQNYPLENGRKPLESVENYSKKTLSYLKPNLFNNPSTKKNPIMSVRKPLGSFRLWRRVPQEYMTIKYYN